MLRSKTFAKRRVCCFCADSKLSIDYKDPFRLKKFTTEKGKIIPRRVSSNCAKHQRALARAIRRSRQIALLAFTVK